MSKNSSRSMDKSYRSNTEQPNFKNINEQYDTLIELENSNKRIKVGQKINAVTPDIKIKHTYENLTPYYNKTSTLKRNNFVFNATG